MQEYIQIFNSNGIYNCKQYITKINEAFLIEKLNQQEQFTDKKQQQTVTITRKRISELIAVKYLLKQKLNQQIKSTESRNINKLAQNQPNNINNNIAGKYYWVFFVAK